MQEETFVSFSDEKDGNKALKKFEEKTHVTTDLFPVFQGFENETIKPVYPVNYFLKLVNFYSNEKLYINGVLIWTFFTIAFIGSVAQTYTSSAMATFSFSLYNLAGAVMCYLGSPRLYPRFYKGKPSDSVRKTELILLVICLFITILYLINVSLIGPKLENFLSYSQLSGLIVFQVITRVLLQQAGTLVYLLDVNMDRFGEKNGLYLTVIMFAMSHLLNIYVINWQIVLLFTLLGSAGMFAWGKLRLKYNTILIPLFTHYLFHLSLIFSFSVISLYK
jgi:hypothetical protein